MPITRFSLIIRRCHWPLALLAVTAVSVNASEPSLGERLRQSHFKIIHESYVDNNWELFVMDADGAHPRNLTGTPNVNELYPKVSPDGSRITFVVDEGEGRDTIRSVWVMNSDGSERRKVADYARQPFWSPDSKIIGYLPQEYPKFNVIDYFTKGMMFYELASGKATPHPNSDKLHHLYNPEFSPNGKWIVATVHAGMGFSHAILLIEAHGDKIIDLGIPGCRPIISPDGKFIAWGPGDHEIATAPLDTDAVDPRVGERRLRIFDEQNKIYHVDWSPNGEFLSISRGPDGEGDVTKPHTYTAACEIVGVHAQGWNIYAVPAGAGAIHLDQPNADALELTSDGNSNKESDWFQPAR